MTASGTLFVCATPLGHLDDVTPRLLSTLREVNAICAEDTRHTQKLLARFEIHTPLTAVQEHTSPAKIRALVARLEQGENLALVTDAGTPGVSDPGPQLVRVALEQGITVSPIPGPCALVAALSVSGFDAQRFSFLGFLPRKPGKLRKALTEALGRGETLVLYESPYRVQKLTAAIAALSPQVPVVVCRELTKRFEEVLRGTATEVASEIAGRTRILGEFTLVVAPISGLDILTAEEAVDDVDEPEDEAPDPATDQEEEPGEELELPSPEHD